jgi:uncharacterized lipoprotein YajG
MTILRLLAIITVFFFAACSDQSKQQQNSTSSPEPNPQVDLDKTPNSSTGGDSQSVTPSGNEDKPNLTSPAK